MALDMGIDPDVIRRMNIRDRNKLLLVSNGRKAGIKQIAASQKVTTFHQLDL